MSGEDAAKTGKIAVWWDMKDCPVPDSIDAHRVCSSIEGGLKKKGYSGPVSITAYGDQKQTPGHLLRALSSTGVAVVHIRSESTCAVMYMDMVKWRENNPPPATMMIITNQMLDVFHCDLARLQQRTTYNLFLAYSIKPYAVLYVATLKKWLWQKLLAGTTSTSTDTAGELSTFFHCKSCSLDCRSVKSFKKHLSAEKHSIQEVLQPKPTQLLPATNKWGKNYSATPEYATAKIHVFWDMSDCSIPDGYDARLVRPNLEGAFKELGYSGPVSISAFGDHKQTPEHHLQALSSTGIDVVHAIPDIIYARMFNDIMTWRYDNPAPATMMIISDTAEYFLANTLAMLQQGKKYNLFWAYSYRPSKLSILLTSAEWLWDSLLAVTKRHVLRKCSGSTERVESTGMFYCKPCFSMFKRLDEFMKHLSSEKHISRDESITQHVDDSEKLRLYRLKKECFPKRKRLKKAPSRGCD